jgi:nucleoside-diphosphate-sugar epimerase
VLVTGGAGAIGTAVVRRLLADPAYELRISDARPAPQWMREGCEIHSGDLRAPAQALAAARGCAQVIHLAAFTPGAPAPAPRPAPSPAPAHMPSPAPAPAMAPAPVSAGVGALPHTRLAFETALHNSVIRAALQQKAERFVFVSSALVFERAEIFPTPEDHLPHSSVPLSADGYARLTGERYCRAAHEEHGFPYTICRPFGVYGPPGHSATPDGKRHVDPHIDPLVSELLDGALAGRRPLKIHGLAEQTRTLTHVEDVAEGIIAALRSPAGANEDFNISASRERTAAEIASVIWEACGEDPDALSLKSVPAREPAVQRSWPSVEKARELLGWQARIELEEGIAQTIHSLRIGGAL